MPNHWHCLDGGARMDLLLERLPFEVSLKDMFFNWPKAPGGYARPYWSHLAPVSSKNLHQGGLLANSKHNLATNPALTSTSIYMFWGKSCQLKTCFGHTNFNIRTWYIRVIELRVLILHMSPYIDLFVHRKIHWRPHRFEPGPNMKWPNANTGALYRHNKNARLEISA